MACDILSRVADEMKICPTGMFNMQLDESRDAGYLDQLLVYITHVHNDDMETEFLFCKTLETTTTARDAFKVGSDSFEGQGIEWENLRQFVRTDPRHVGLQIRSLDFGNYCRSKSNVQH
jgi:hypothetical protein